ncbi:hypothetical protein [Pseudacidovorax sp. RU35E]|uniref:hypothetical protein n=1 Tax=Pseudacidovorax sp. RU35E TaxID=1907403 RepID=UPI0009556005|nr:hypothetical protein [Pseudacidovorax sp. RU35E]SIR70629.1 hypothetical protein SAMN05880557_11740 [Pseudacidovorax sp. RU35E]
MRLLSPLLIALAVAGCAGTRVPPGCPATASDMKPSDLYGWWDARFQPDAAVADVELRPHPEYAGSVRGTIARAGAPLAQLAGDINPDGQLSLDESRDGRTISAVWTADLQPASCGKEFTGTWRNTATEQSVPVALRKRPSP